MRRAKIVCTLGPATNTPEKIGELIDAGMDVARLNFSHGDQQDHARTLATVRSEAEKRGRAVAALLDLQGPKIRVGKFEGGSAELRTGQPFILTTDGSVLGNAQRASTEYRNLPNDVSPGDTILLDDGFLSLEVESVDGTEVHTRVTTGGTLKDKKGINLPGVAVSAPAITEKDRRDIDFGLRLGVDFIALSFVRAPEDVIQARELATADGASIPIIAKIEKPQAVDRLQEIIDVSDGIMVARGDLGVETGPEKVPLVQKQIIRETNRRGKIVITATQMLESMIKSKRPTRAEASDVANALLDGSDALMLSGETAVGEHPNEVVRTMDRIICEVEQSPAFRHRIETPDLLLPVSASAVAHAAVIAARQMNLRFLAVITVSGGVARLMSEYRPDARILALTTDEVTYRRLALYWGVEPIMIAPMATTDEMYSMVEQVLRSHHIVDDGERVVITAGIPVGSGESTNMLKIHRIGG